MPLPTPAYLVIDLLRTPHFGLAKRSVMGRCAALARRRYCSLLLLFQTVGFLIGLLWRHSCASTVC